MTESQDPFVRVENGWFVAYDQQGHRIARFGTRAAADAACTRWKNVGARMAKAPSFSSRPSTPKENPQLTKTPRS